MHQVQIRSTRFSHRHIATCWIKKSFMDSKHCNHTQPYNHTAKHIQPYSVQPFDCNRYLEHFTSCTHALIHWILSKQLKDTPFLSFSACPPSTGFTIFICTIYLHKYWKTVLHTNLDQYYIHILFKTDLGIYI